MVANKKPHAWCPQCGGMVHGSGRGFEGFGCCSWNCADKFRASSDEQQQYAARYGLVLYVMSQLAEAMVKRGHSQAEIEEAFSAMGRDAFDKAANAC